MSLSQRLQRASMLVQSFLTNCLLLFVTCEPFDTQALTVCERQLGLGYSFGGKHSSWHQGHWCLRQLDHRSPFPMLRMSIGKAEGLMPAMSRDHHELRGEEGLCQASTGSLLSPPTGPGEE